MSAQVVGPYQPPLTMGYSNTAFTGIYGASFGSVIVRYPSIATVGYANALNATNIAMDLNGNPAILSYGSEAINRLGPERNSGNDSSPSISGTGNRIAFIRQDSSGVGQLHAANLDGSGDVQLTSGTSPCFTPAFSPDGTSILFGQPDPNNASLDSIFKIPAGGGAQVRVTPLGYGYYNPVWSPSGAQFACVQQTTVDTQTPVIDNSDGSGQIFLPGGLPSNGATSLAFIPNTNAMLETYYSSAQSKSFLYQIDSLAPSGGFILKSSAYIMSNISVAPTGSACVYRNWDPSFSGIVVRDLLTGSENIVASNYYTTPSWGPYPTARAVVGSGAALGVSSVGGFLFGQNANGIVTCFIGVDAKTRTAITMTPQANASPTNALAVCTIAADSITNLSYMNSLQGGVTSVATATSPIRGAVVALNTVTGTVASVLPFVQTAVVKKPGTLTFTGHFVGAFDKDGKQISSKESREITLDKTTGSVVSIR